MISEGDILYKEHDPSTGRKGGPLAWLIDGNTPAVIKSRALTVREAMTSPALTVTPWSSVSEAARLMTERGINRLPVVRNDELVGIVTRTDLVRAFTRSDGEIERELRDEVLERTLWLERDTVERRGEARCSQARRNAPDPERCHSARADGRTDSRCRLRHE